MHTHSRPRHNYNAGMGHVGFFTIKARHRVHQARKKSAVRCWARRILLRTICDKGFRLLVHALLHMQDSVALIHFRFCLSTGRSNPSLGPSAPEPEGLLMSAVGSRRLCGLRCFQARIVNGAYTYACCRAAFGLCQPPVRFEYMELWQTVGVAVLLLRDMPDVTIRTLCHISSSSIQEPPTSMPMPIPVWQETKEINKKVRGHSAARANFACELFLMRARAHSGPLAS